MKFVNLINEKVTFFLGQTGSGKTFSAVKEAERIGRFAYLSPTGTLTCDTFKQYQKSGDSLNAIGYKIQGDYNHFGVYCQFEFLENLNNYDVIILDECHWAFEFQNHGFFVREILEKFHGKIFMVTGTVNFLMYDAKVVQCLPKEIFSKEKVSFEKSLERAKYHTPTLIIGQTFKDCDEASQKINELGIKYVRIGRDKNNLLDISKAIEAFEAGEISCIIGTNIFSQGINLNCENLIIWDKNSYVKSYYDYDVSFGGSRSANDSQLNVQRIGRLGRLNKTKKNAYLTYSVAEYLNEEDLLSSEINLKIEITKDFCDLPSEKEEVDYKPYEFSVEQQHEIYKILLDFKKINKNTNPVVKLGDIYNLLKVKI